MFTSPFPSSLQEYFINNRFTLINRVAFGTPTGLLTFGFNEADANRQNTVVFIENITLTVIESAAAISDLFVRFSLATGIIAELIAAEHTDSLENRIETRQALFQQATFTNSGVPGVLLRRDMVSGTPTDLEIPGYIYRFGVNDSLFPQFQIFTDSDGNNITSVTYTITFSEVIL